MVDNSDKLCDPITGVCSVDNFSPNINLTAKIDLEVKPLKLVYITDPICSACWGIEAQLRKLKLEYGHIIDFSYHMGGLLPSLKLGYDPKNLAQHWDEMSLHFAMPIDGDVWLEDPIESSYPPSIGFKAAQLQDDDNGEKSIKFLRKLREQLFLYKKNIAKSENILASAKAVGLDLAKFEQDFQAETSKNLFLQDLELAKKLHVRGFPTIFLFDQNNNKELIYGVRPYGTFVDAVKKLMPSAQKQNYAKDLTSLFKRYNSLTLNEVIQLSELDQTESLAKLNEKEANGELVKFSCKNGAIWFIK